MQRQLEVELSLRKKLCTEEDIEEVRSLVETLVTFFDELRRASERLGVQLAAVFQDLLWRSVDAPLEMDKQGGMGNIPMHQAKVLDRRERLESEIGNLEDVFGHEHLHQMVGSVRDIRALLRVKMEDSNDLQMAEDTIRSTHFFFSTLTRYAKDKEQPEYAALETLRAL